jgi:hypothetical protein
VAIVECLLGFTAFLVTAAARNVTVNAPGGTPFWQTAVVAVGAALLGSLVGGYATFRASEALEQRRREARAKIRRKAKVYTPIRLELLELQAARKRGDVFDSRGIIRKPPPPFIFPAASLHLWKDLVDDGRALTAASETIREALNEVDALADRLNEQVSETREVFEERSEDIFASIGAETSIVNWIETDMPKLLTYEFDDLNVTGAGLPGDGGMGTEARLNFESMWKEDEAISRATEATLQIDAELGRAIDVAVSRLEEAMLRIGKKYEEESPRD